MTFLFVQANGQSVQVEKLQTALANLQKEDNQLNQRDYFDLFPNSFVSFESTFGYKNEKAAPLYDGFEFVQAFFHLDSIPKKKQLEKWINISIGGNWDADAVNYFQHNLQPKILENVNLSQDILKERTSEEIESFFYFFFSGIHPRFEAIPDEFKELRNRNKAFYDALIKGHKRAIHDSGH